MMIEPAAMFAEAWRVCVVLRQVAQLHHELNLKDELLQFYTNAAEEGDDEAGSSPTLALQPHPSNTWNP